MTEFWDPKRSPNKRMDYSYYDEDEEERRWGRGMVTPQERRVMQRTMMRNAVEWGSDSRSIVVQDHVFEILRSSGWLN